jgi:uncharacterized membrane protein YkoI
MKKTLLASALLLAPFAAHAHDALSACAASVAKTHPGKIVKLEVKTEDKATVYEFDVQKADGSMSDIECAADSGKVTEVEQEVAATDAKWTSKVKVSEADAKATALKAHPGTVVETEYEIEPNGALSYSSTSRAPTARSTRSRSTPSPARSSRARSSTVQAGEG